MTLNHYFHEKVIYFDTKFYYYVTMDLIKIYSENLYYYYFERLI